MTPYQRKKLDMEFRAFTSKNFEKPTGCRNLDQIRFYIGELCNKIEDYRQQFDYVPDWAYGLLSQYNEKQNQMLNKDAPKENA
jgi:hypothetical protein